MLEFILGAFFGATVGVLDCLLSQIALESTNKRFVEGVALKAYDEQGGFQDGPLVGYVWIVARRCWFPIPSPGRPTCVANIH